METIADMALVAARHRLSIAVRPPKANREWITRPARCGSVEPALPQGRERRACARDRRGVAYAPRGLRGNGGLGPSTDFETTAASQDRARLRTTKCSSRHVRDEAAFADLDEIAAMDGIDA
jgi:2-dehydro-3-deoxyglucarate aldolase/4-hydroxy-2-oxoheptanedioate aldolase